MENGKRFYSNRLTADTNIKGVLDIDPIKGCEDGIKKYGERGCYHNCYAIKIAKFRGFDFSKSIVRRIFDSSQFVGIIREIHKNKLPLVRMGTFGDPSFDWDHTLRVADFVKTCGKKIVVVTKHWRPMNQSQIKKAGRIGVFINTSISALDSPDEIKYRLGEYNRYKKYGTSVLRVVTCKFLLKTLDKAQDSLLSNENVIDNPMRISKNHPLVREKIMSVKRVKDIDSYTWISRNNPKSFIGHCYQCSDLCGLIYGK